MGILFRLGLLRIPTLMKTKPQSLLSLRFRSLSLGLFFRPQLVRDVSEAGFQDEEGGSCCHTKTDSHPGTQLAQRILDSIHCCDNEETNDHFSCYMETQIEVKGDT